MASSYKYWSISERALQATTSTISAIATAVIIEVLVLLPVLRMVFEYVQTAAEAAANNAIVDEANISIL